VISRGFSILPPGEASQFKSFSVDNYESAKSNPEVVSKETARLRKQGFMVPWKEWSTTYSLAIYLAMSAADCRCDTRALTGSAPG
jgi:hypothetical protein